MSRKTEKREDLLANFSKRYLYVNYYTNETTRRLMEAWSVLKIKYEVSFTLSPQEADIVSCPLQADNLQTPFKLI